MSSAIIKSVLPSGWFQATEVNMVFLGSFQTVWYLVSQIFWHWSNQWDDFFQYQHLCQNLLVSLALKRNVDVSQISMGQKRACTISSLQSSTPLVPLTLPVLCHPRSRDHTFRSPAHIFYSIIDNMWLLSMSFWLPTSFSVWKLRFTKWTTSQNRSSSSDCSPLNFTISCITVSKQTLDLHW